jgi:hypothetical protein
MTALCAIEMTMGLTAFAVGAAIAGSARRFPARQRALELCAGILLVGGLALLGAPLAPLVALGRP